MVDFGFWGHITEIEVGEVTMGLSTHPPYPRPTSVPTFLKVQNHRETIPRLVFSVSLMFYIVSRPYMTIKLICGLDLR